MVIDAIYADIDEHASESVCLLLENKCSTETLTADTAVISHAIQESIRKLEECCCDNNEFMTRCYSDVVRYVLLTRVTDSLLVQVYRETIH